MYHHTHISVHNEKGPCAQVWQGMVEGLTTLFLEPCNGTFWVGCIYGRNDDAARFGFFCGAALEFLNHHAGDLRLRLFS